MYDLPVKRPRLVSENGTTTSKLPFESSIIGGLPNELVVKIFHLIPTVDLYRSCALVCHSWSDFLKSKIFMEITLRREFGNSKVNAMLATSASTTSRFSDYLFNSPLFRRIGWLWNDVHGEKVLDAAATRAALAKDGICWSPCYDGQMFCFINLRMLLPEVFDILRLPLFITASTELSLLGVFDQNYKILLAIEPAQSWEADEFLIEYQPNISYLGLRLKDSFSVSLLTPSVAAHLRKRIPELLIQTIYSNLSEMAELLDTPAPPSGSIWSRIRCNFDFTEPKIID